VDTNVAQDRHQNRQQERTWHEEVTVLGDQIYKQRQKKGHSLRDVAKLTGVTFTTVTRTEGGQWCSLFTFYQLFNYAELPKHLAYEFLEDILKNGKRQ
jgi:transcriptional regulator with XRE-family HTH domain